MGPASSFLLPPLTTRSSQLNGNDQPTIPKRIGRTYTVVWCDSTIGLDNNLKDDTYTVLQLRRVVNKKRQLIHAFNDIDECKEFLIQVNNVCLIVSGGVGQQLVPAVHNLQQISVIFVFCMNQRKHKAWAKHYKKVRGVYTQIEGICDELNTYFLTSQLSEYEQLQCDFFRRPINFSETNPEDLLFVYSICSQMILSKIRSTKQDMFEYCQREYLNDDEQRMIEDLNQNYSTHEPIWWLTKDRFYQELVNQALRMSDLYSLFALNWFIRDINNHITLLYQKSTKIVQPLVLYVVHTASNEIHEKFQRNKGGLICINEFLFANSEYTLAQLFLEDQNLLPNTRTGTNILFKITILPNISPNVNYANIGAITRFVHEKEYLFSMGSLFRIENIAPLEKFHSTWIADLTLIDKNDSQVIALTRFIRENYLYEEYDLEPVALALKSRLYQFKITRHFFEVGNNWSANQIRSILVRLHLGLIYDCFREFDKALNEYRTIIEYLQELIPKDQHEQQIYLAPFYSMMGLTNQEKGLNSTAFDQAYQSFALLSRVQKKTMLVDQMIAASHSNLGLVLQQQQRFSEAISHYAAALKIQRQYLPANHSELILLMHTIERLGVQHEQASDQFTENLIETTIF